MNFISAITAIVLSRTLFVFINDPEGPNLLIVLLLSAVVYAVSSLLVHFLASSITGLKKLLLIIFVQVVAISVLFLIFILFPTNPI